MKEPLPRGSAIGMQRMASWVEVFAGYRHIVNEQRIDRWLNQFRQEHRDLAARILDCVDFISNEQMEHAFRSILQRLDGWNRDENLRRGKWRFVAFSVSAGESGDTMLHRFRLANGITGRRYNDLFVHKSELLREGLGPDDTVVFVDDFAGTGNQACDSWPEIEELLPNGPHVYLVLVVASNMARERIGNATGLTVVPHFELGERDNIFSPQCIQFTEPEKEEILEYCRVADSRNPRGFGDCGFVLVFVHNCPNNTIPILHQRHNRWEGLFRREM